MGYYTDYRLKVFGRGKTTAQHMEQIKERFKIKAFYSSKWYDHEEELKEYSKEHEGQLFELTGFGEDKCDIWRAYFKEGKMNKEQACIEFWNYDEDRLK